MPGPVNEGAPAPLFFDNQVLERAGAAAPDGGGFLRVLRVRPGHAEAAVYRIPDAGALPEWVGLDDLAKALDAGDLRPVAEDPFAASVRRDSDLTEAEKAGRDARLRAVRPLVSDPECRVLDPLRRGGAVAGRAREIQVSAPTLYRLLRLWWTGGQVDNALVPRFAGCGGRGKERMAGAAKRGRPRRRTGARPDDDDEGDDGVGDAAPGPRGAGINVDAETRAKLQEGARFLKLGMPWRKAYRETLLLHFSERVVVDGRPVLKPLPAARRPTRAQFRYWVGKVVRPRCIARAVDGEAGFARKRRPRTGTSAGLAHGPGSIFQIDATVCDVLLRSRLNPGRLVGRPTLYIVVDHWSRLVVGFHVGLAAPSYQGAKFALENAMTPKGPFCAAFGVDIDENDWPARHLCAELLSDRGPEFTGAVLGAGADALGIKLSNTPPYRPDLKGIVENKFRLLADDAFRWEPGALHRRERGDPRQPLDTRHDLDSFTKLMILWVRKYNASMRVASWPAGWRSPDGGDPTPLQLWREGCLLRGSPQMPGQARVRAALLDRVEARETEHGLRCKDTGLRYRPLREGTGLDFARIRGRRWRQLKLGVDPRDVTQAYLVGERAHAFERLVLIDEDAALFGGRSREEVLDFRKVRAAANVANESADLEAWYEHRLQSDELRRSLPPAGGGARARVGPDGIRAERRAERREADRASVPWLSDGQRADPAPAPAAAEAPVPAPGPEGGLRGDRLRMLSRLRGLDLEGGEG